MDTKHPIKYNCIINNFSTSFNWSPKDVSFNNSRKKKDKIRDPKKLRTNQRSSFKIFFIIKVF